MAAVTTDRCGNAEGPVEIHENGLFCCFPGERTYQGGSGRGGDKWTCATCGKDWNGKRGTPRWMQESA